MCTVCNRSFLSLGDVSDHFLHEHVQNLSPPRPKKPRSDLDVDVVDLTISPEKKGTVQVKTFFIKVLIGCGTILEALVARGILNTARIKKFFCCILGILVSVLKKGAFIHGKGTFSERRRGHLSHCLPPQFCGT